MMVTATLLLLVGAGLSIGRKAASAGDGASADESYTISSGFATLATRKAKNYKDLRHSYRAVEPDVRVLRRMGVGWTC